MTNPYYQVGPCAIPSCGHDWTAHFEGDELKDPYCLLCEHLSPMADHAFSKYATCGEERDYLLGKMRSFGLIGRLIAWRYERRFRKIQDDQRRRISKAMDS